MFFDVVVVAVVVVVVVNPSTRSSGVFKNVVNKSCKCSTQSYCRLIYLDA